MTVKDLIENLQQYPNDLEVGVRFESEARDGWQDMYRSIEGVRLGSVTPADVLCEKVELPSSSVAYIHRLSERLVIL